jgi:hypothetical protein
MVPWRYRNGRIRDEVYLFHCSIPDLLSSFVVPLFGYVVDQCGHRLTWLVLCSLALVISHLGLGLTMWNPIPFMVLLGLGYAIYGVVLWPCIAIVVQQQEQFSLNSVKLLGTSFGIASCALNLSLTLIPIITAQIRIWRGSFLPVEIFYASLAGLGGLLVVPLYLGSSSSILEQPSFNSNDISSEETVGSNGMSTVSDGEEPWPEPARLLFQQTDDQVSFGESFLSQRSMGLDSLQVLGPSKFMTRNVNSALFSPLVEDSDDEISIE